MKNLSRANKILFRKNRSSSRKLTKPLNYAVVIFCSLLLCKNSIAQSYSLSTTGAIPDSSAMLDIISSDKGLLIPRVNLLSVTDSATITHPAISLQVYNTNNTMGKGFWYWDGTKWVRQMAGLGVDSLVIGTSTSSHLYNLQVTGTAGVTTSITTPVIVGGSGTTSSLTYKTTTGVGTTGADHIFKVGNNGGTEAMRVLNEGNIGIGTPTPDVHGNWGSTHRLVTISTTTSSKYAGLQLLGGAGVGGSLNFGNQTIRHSGIDSKDGSHMAFYTNNSNSGTTLTERMRIKNTGEVGIGTASPAHKLDISNSTSTINALNVNSTTTSTTTVNQAASITYDITPTADITAVTAVNGNLYYRGSQNNTSSTGISYQQVGLNFPGTATITNSSGTITDLRNTSTGTMTNLMGNWVVAARNTGGGTITNFHANRVSAQTVGSTLSTAYTGENAAASGRYNLYMSGTAQNYMEGSVGIGNPTPTVAKLEVYKSSSNTTIGNDGLMILKNTNSTNNNWNTLYFSDANSFQNVGVGIQTTDHTNHLSDFVIATRNSTYTEKLRLNSSGNLGLGTGTSISAKIHALSTTEQLRLGYDASNYYSTTVGSSGAVTFDATGSGSAFSFSDAVSITSTAPALNDSTTKVATTAFVDRAITGITAGSSTITNDASTNATMYPVWVTANSGSLPLKVSSTKLSFNPSTGKLTATGDATINTLTVGLGAGSISSNTGLGYQVLNANTSGQDNTFVGYQSGKANTTGGSNTGVGNQALLSNTSANRNTAVGAFSLYSSTTGESNTGLGFQSLYSNTTGEKNTANGSKALYSNTTGYYNSVEGFEAMYANTTGSQNVAIGYMALNNNTTGSLNTALGSYALRYQQTGIRNMGIGSSALEGSTTPANNTGNDNVAVGEESLVSNTSGSNNVGLGNASLIFSTTGSGNSGIGHRTGYTNTTGSYNTFLGYYADADANNYTYATAIGAGAIVLGNSRIQLGNTTTDVYQTSGHYYTSDGRFKTNVKEEVKGLDFIKKLRPVTYQMDTRMLDEFFSKNLPDSIKAKRNRGVDFTRSSTVTRSGFIAQEVEQAAQETGFNSTIVHHPENSDDIYGISYSEIIVPLVKAIQEQQQQLQEKETAITNLQNQVNLLLQRIEQLETH